MSDNEKKEGSFDPECITDIQDKLLSHNYVLRDFATLLMSSDLSDFATQNLEDTLKSDDFEKANLRWGLSQIIDLYLEHQERILTEYVDQYYESDIHLVRHAKFIIDAAGHGAYTSKDVAIRKLRKEAANLDTVINRDGELKEKASELKETCMGYLKQLAANAKECG